jgi:hypothetical protein
MERISKAVNKWRATLDVIGTEYPFGTEQRVLNEEDRLHCGTGPAFITPTRCKWYENGKLHGLSVDIFGSTTYFWRGVMVPPGFINKPQELDFETVIKHPNTEVRYVGIHLYGLDRMFEEKRLKIVHETDEPARQLLRIDIGLSEPIMMLRVENSTAESDGTFRTYFLSVPPTMTTCEQAVAWTFGLEAKEYQPELET